jgi:hypothetical protein
MRLGQPVELGRIGRAGRIARSRVGRSLVRLQSRQLGVLVGIGELLGRLLRRNVEIGVASRVLRPGYRRRLRGRVLDAGTGAAGRCRKQGDRGKAAAKRSKDEDGRLAGAISHCLAPKVGLAAVDRHWTVSDVS